MLYRVAREAIANVCKHAGASRVAVQLRQADAHAVLSIEDDGAGSIQRSSGRIISACDSCVTWWLQRRRPSHRRQRSGAREPGDCAVGVAMIKVVLVDDHLVVVEGLRLLVEAFDDMEVVGSATDEREGCGRSSTCARTSSSGPADAGHGRCRGHPHDSPQRTWTAVVILTTFAGRTGLAQPRRRRSGLPDERC